MPRPIYPSGFNGALAGYECPPLDPKWMLDWQEPDLPTSEMMMAMEAKAAMPVPPPVPLAELANAANDLALAMQTMLSKHVAVFADPALAKWLCDEGSAVQLNLRKIYLETPAGIAQTQAECDDFYNSMSDVERKEFFYDDGERPQDDPRRPKSRHDTTIRRITKRFGVTHAVVNHWLAGIGGQREPLRHTRTQHGRRDRITILNQDLFDWLWTNRRDLVDKVWGPLKPAGWLC